MYTSLPAVLPILMICPCCLIKYGKTAFEVKSKPFTLVSIMVSQSSIFASRNESRPSARPALLTKISTACHAAGKSFNCAKTASLSCTSNTKLKVFTPYFFSIAVATSANFSLRRAVKIKFQPPAANFSAIALPNPELAPVINIIFDMVYG